MVDISDPIFSICEVFCLMGETFHLHPHAAIYWPVTDTVIIADIHLGKATHFRRHGIPVPAYVQEETLEKLTSLLLGFSPARVLLLGDLFHSDYNEEWEDFADLVLAFDHIDFVLVPGNHDRLTAYQYEKYGIQVFQEPYLEGPFAFSHHPMDVEAAYNLAGHVHPAVSLQGKGDRLRLPCFYFGKQAGLLPAFGAFTGTYTIEPKRKDDVFVLADERVLKVSA